METSKLQIIIQVLLLIALVAFAIFFIANKKEMASNPIKAVTEQYNINTCSCQTNDGETINFNSTTVWKQRLPWLT